MKLHILIVSTLIFTVTACNKKIDLEYHNSNYVQNVQRDLKDSVSEADYSQLDISKAIITNPDSSYCYLRIPYKNFDISGQFALVKTNSTGKIIQGYFIDLKKDSSIENSPVFNGFIRVTYLSRKLKFESSIYHGSIALFLSVSQPGRTSVVPSDSHVLPPVIVTCYVQDNNYGGSYGGSYSDWINIMSFFDDALGTSGLYSSLDNRSGSGDGKNQSGGGGFGGLSAPTYQGLSKDQNILIDFEAGENLNPIDLAKYLKCFSNIPDDGAQCTIKIYTDIPVDDHPEKLLNWQTGSPGHTFLQLQKQSGNVSIEQNIGFYPVQGWKSIVANSPVAGKFVDNSNHEYNAGLTMQLTPQQFQLSLDHMLQISKNLQYDIDDYNCTDFALDVFNYTRGTSAIRIPKYYIPGSLRLSGSNTPEGLYNKLVEMQRANIERPNITIPGIKQWADLSNGPCN